MVHSQFCTPAVAVIGLVLFGGSAQAATYYVAKNGNDGNSCAQARSVTSPRQTLEQAVGCLTAGDTLLVRAGVYAESLNNVVPSVLMVKQGANRSVSWRERDDAADFRYESLRLLHGSAVHRIRWHQHGWLEAGQRRHQD